MSQLEPVDISEACFNEFVSLVHDMTGITIRCNRRAMLVGRLRSRIRNLQLSSYESYLAYIKSHREEHDQFINVITTNETYFYRTPRIWEYVTKEFLPRWCEENPGRTLSVWSAAASTGEEAHTLGILLQQFKEHHPGFEYRVLGTDISPRVVDIAVKGVYKGRSIARFREAEKTIFTKYMTGDDEHGYSVLPEIKSRIQFNISNLFNENTKRGTYDLILLRNVLIYFSKEEQKTVMSILHSQLVPQGIAIIGESETLKNIETDFEPVKPTVYRAIDVSLKTKAA